MSERQRTPKICDVEGCGKPHNARGLCRNHYMQQLYREWKRDPEYRERERKRQREYKRTPVGRGNRRASYHKRRALKNGMGGKFTAADWRALVASSPRCYYCKRRWTKETGPPTHDHIIPLARGGPNSPENSVCACKSCNSTKGARRVNPVNGQGILI